VDRTELVQLQRPPNVCMLVHARVRTKTRGNPDRVMCALSGRVVSLLLRTVRRPTARAPEPGLQKRLTLRMQDKVSETASGLLA
jgi:hypothetical protein